MDDLLEVVSSVKDGETVEPNSGQITPHHDATTHGIEAQQKLRSPEDALDILKSRPGKSEVLDALSFIDPAGAAEGQFNVTVPGSTGAQIVHVLVSTTIPDHWHTLASDDKSVLSSKPGDKRRPRAALLRCLSSVAGIGAIVAQLRKLLSNQTTTGEDGKHSGTQIIIRDLLTVLSSLLKPRGLIFHIYSDLSKYVQNSVQKQLAWKELVSLLAAGKVLSTAAEASTLAGGLSQSKSLWVGEGSSYAMWVGEVISHMATRLQAGDSDGWTYLSSFMGRALTLGYNGRKRRTSTMMEVPLLIDLL